MPSVYDRFNLVSDFSLAEDIGFTKTAAIKFLNTLTDAVDITVLDFDTEVRAARYGQAEFARLIERIRQQKTRGFTALYDAVGIYLHAAAEQDGRSILLLQRMAEVTGGQAFFPGSVKELDGVYEKVVAEIRAQYTLGYLSTNEKADGSWRKVDVKVVRRDTKELRVRSRRGYFAPFKR